MNKDYGVTQRNREKRNSRIILNIIILALLLLVEVYLMINFPRIYILLAVVGAASLFLIFRIANSLFKIQEEREEKREKEFESIFKSEKASYILLRKNFADLAEMLYLLKGDSGLPLEDLISAQKSIAKVTINKNKENSKAVLNSTEELKSYLLEMSEKFAEIQNVVKENVDNVNELVKNEVQSKNLDIIVRLNEMEKAINSEMEKGLNSITISSQTVEPQELPQTYIPKEKPEEPEISEIEDLTEETEEPVKIEMPEIEEFEEEPKELEIPEIESLDKEPEELEIPEIESLDEEPEELEIPELEELSEKTEESEEFPEIESLDMPQMEEIENIEPRVEPLTDDGSSADLEDLEEKVRELQQMAAEEEPEISSLEVEKSEEDISSLMEDITPSMEEINHKMTPDEIEQLFIENDGEDFIPEMDLSNVSEEIPSMEEIDKMLASIPVPELDKEEENPEPVSLSNDSGHVMTPDEIAALIGETASEIPEPEPVPVESAVTEDANHVMTPDEIAALLASV